MLRRPRLSRGARNNRHALILSLGMHNIWKTSSVIYNIGGRKTALAHGFNPCGLSVLMAVFFSGDSEVGAGDLNQEGNRDDNIC